MAFNKVKEAAYLTAENCARYRVILRYFYIQHERMREFIFPEEVMTHVRSQDGFSDYEEDNLHIDLNQLVKWGNLTPRQELGSSKTIEEYKKKRFRYQPTPYTIEFERMLTEMENKEEVFGGVLERTQFNRLYSYLQEMELVVLKNKTIADEEANQLWEDIQTYFRQIVENTSDYIGYISSEEVEERMKTEAFLTYKDQFTAYLREFIRAMQSTSEQIRTILQQLQTEHLYHFFEQVWRHKTQARLEEVDVSHEAKPFEEYTGRWLAVQSWFRGTQSYGKSESEMLLERTTDAIRKITQVVQRMGERNQNLRSRREEYLHLASWFSELDDIEEAHKLYAVAFGFDHTRHYFIDQNPSDNLYTDTWELDPMIHTTKPMIRTYREKTRANVVVDRSKERLQSKELFLKEKQLEQKWIEQYIKGQKIELETISSVQPAVRQIFLNWIGKAMGHKDRTVQTDLGLKIRLHFKEGRISLNAEDGSIDMPNVWFEIIGNEGGDGHA
ncbi:hypothetical protein GCM10008929_16500 [Alkalibacterium psychrotolerans]